MKCSQTVESLTVVVSPVSHPSVLSIKALSGYSRYHTVPIEKSKRLCIKSLVLTLETAQNLSAFAETILHSESYQK